jgi:hypothetical protein
MPRPRFPYLLKEVTRHGAMVYYVRSGKGPRTRVRGEYGSTDFKAAYYAAMGIGEPKKPRKTKTGTASRSGYIYFIGSGRHVKIGFASNVKKRLGGLQVGHHEKLKVLHKEKGTIRDEARFHAQFAHLRQRGEWFSLHGELAEYIGQAPPDPEQERNVIL